MGGTLVEVGPVGVSVVVGVSVGGFVGEGITGVSVQKGSGVDGLSVQKTTGVLVKGDWSVVSVGTQAVRRTIRSNKQASLRIVIMMGRQKDYTAPFQTADVK